MPGALSDPHAVTGSRLAAAAAVVALFAVSTFHPLYTYIADTAPGQARGNNLNLNGGLWHEVTVP
jgi:hypothetical protein